MGRVGLGNVRQQVTINGSRVTAVPGLTPVTQNQGFLALNSNQGVFERDVFNVVPELNAKLDVHLTRCVDLTLGYTFIYFNHIARPGDQIDQVIDPTQTTPQPAFQFRDSDLWLHGFNVGVRAKF